ncbi:hypothetical protein LTS18_011642 [Coniosporium uncinatum]|uniref:Uncharacterized protein n=1 Tax=Coniosporium uncinatum TaxID=93489 RepID=A0ACC3DJQ5_9PEZI|nr:hypothetical protein LTS18_011642 [Coniosporium uncinatum]
MVRSQQGLEWARGRRCGFMETSAREMVNIEETFALLVRRVVEARRLQANGGVEPTTTEKTKSLPPVSEKPKTTIDPKKVPSRNNKDASFWSKLRCW